MTKLEKLLAMTVPDNDQAREPLRELAHKIICDKNESLQDRYEALRYYDMLNDHESSPPGDVADVEFMREVITDYVREATGKGVWPEGED